jgi:hypothetical protein
LKKGCGCQHAGVVLFKTAPIVIESFFCWFEGQAREQPEGNAGNEIGQALMIIASPASSNKADSISAKPRAMTAIDALVPKHFNKVLILRDIIRPIILADTQIPTAFPAITAIPTQSTPPVTEAAAKSHVPIASITIPSTSSMTGPAKIVMPSGVSSFYFSDKILAVIPAEVAVDMIHRKRQGGAHRPSGFSKNIPENNEAVTLPNKNENNTPPIPTRLPVNE